MKKYIYNNIKTNLNQENTEKTTKNKSTSNETSESVQINVDKKKLIVEI